MDEVRRTALLRLYGGEAPEDICASLGVTADELAAWERSTSPRELLGEPAVTATLSAPEDGRPRTDLGLRGPLGQELHGTKLVHVVAGPSDQRCARCGQDVIPSGFAPTASRPAFVLAEVAPEGSGARIVTSEEAAMFEECAP